MKDINLKLTEEQIKELLDVLYHSDESMNIITVISQIVEQTKE